MYPNYRRSMGRLQNDSSEQNRADEKFVIWKYSSRERILPSTPVRTKPKTHVFFDDNGDIIKREPMNISPINRCKLQSEFNSMKSFSDRGRSSESSTLSSPESTYQNKKEKSLAVWVDQKKPKNESNDWRKSDFHNSTHITRRKYQSEFDYLRSFSDRGRFWEKNSSSESSSDENKKEKPVAMSEDQKKQKRHIFFDENRSKFKSEFDYLRSFSYRGHVWEQRARTSNESSSNGNMKEKPSKASEDHSKAKMHLFFNENKSHSDSDSQKSPPIKRSKFGTEDDDVDFPNIAVNQERGPKMHFFFDDSGNPILDSFHSAKSYENMKASPEKSTGKMTGESSFPDQLPYSQEEMEKEYLEVSRDRALRKYWVRRYNLFKRFDQGIMLDRESWYSVTPEDIASSIADKCRCKVIVDGFCGAGGNTIQFALTCEKVYAIDIDPVKIAMARHNARIYGVEDKITFINGDFFKVAPKLKADFIFLSPPWGGPSYLKTDVFDLETMLSPEPFSKMMETARKCANRIVAYLPRNSNEQQLMSEMRNKSISIVDYMLGRKNIALAAYYNMQ